MDINQLKYLVKLSEIQNFSKAAEELYITQPTLSQQIQRLEQELGIKLFERSTRKVTLTEAGNTCARHAAAALKEIEALAAAAENYKRSSSATLLVGVLTVLPQVNITRILANFRETYPNIHIELFFGWSTDILHLLLQEKCDVVISNVYFDNDSQTNDRLEIEPFLEDRMVVVVSRQSPYAAKRQLQIKDFIHENFWITDFHASVQIRFENRIKECGYAMPAFKRCASMTSLIKMVASGSGVSVMSSGVAREYHIPEVKSIPITPRIATSTAIVTRRDTAPSPELKTFKEYFLSQIRM